MMAAHDRLYIEESEFERTMAINTLEVGTMEFDLPEERAMELFESGRAAAEKLLGEDRDRRSVPKQTTHQTG